MGLQIVVAAVENSVVVLQKVKHRITIQSSNSTPYLKELKSRTQTGNCTPTFIAALFTIAKRWKQPTCPSTDELINTVWYSHTVKFHAALKRKEILTYATIWMNLEVIMLSEIRQSQKATYFMIPHI